MLRLTNVLIRVGCVLIFVAILWSLVGCGRIEELNESLDQCNDVADAIGACVNKGALVTVQGGQYLVQCL